MIDDIEEFAEKIANGLVRDGLARVLERKNPKDNYQMIVVGKFDDSMIEKIQNALGKNVRGYGWPTLIRYNEDTNITSWQCWGSCD